MDRFHLMSTFVAVVDTGGFAGASRKLNLSPPAVTRAVAELEERLGVQLLTRTTRVVRVTDAGAQYAEDCRRILVEVESADSAARGVQGSVKGQILVTAPALFGRMFVAPVVRDYLDKYPEVNATCWFMDRVVNMVDEGVDVAVRIGNLPDSSLNAYRIGTVRQVCCASPAYLQRMGEPQTPDDLVAHSIVAATPVTPTQDWRFAGGSAGPVRVAPRFVTNTNDSAVEAAVAGFGITRLMSYQVASLASQGKLQLILQAHEPAALPVHVLYREGRKASMKVRALLDMAIERLSADPAIAGT